MAEIKKVRYTHDAMIDFIIVNPAASQRELAALFGYTESWISQVMSSDSFKARLEARKKEVTDPLLIQSVEERLEGVTRQALEVLGEKLEVTRSAELAAKVLDISTRALGYGARDRTQVQVNAQFVVALPPKANSGQEWQAEHSPLPPPRAQVTLDTVIEVPAVAA